MNKAVLPAEGVRERLALRHKPQQDRSRVRFEALLDAAEEVIAEVGLQGLAMREVARRANLPVSSIYHYLPSTTSLVRALVERQLTTLNGIAEDAMRKHLPLDGEGFTPHAVHGVIDEIASYFLNTPAAPEIWAGLHAYPELRELNLEDTKKNAVLFETYLIHFMPHLEPGQAGVIAVVLVEWISATLRFATSSPAELRMKIVGTLKVLIAHVMTSLSQSPESVSMEALTQLSRWAAPQPAPRKKSAAKTPAIKP
jgi:AcrR family transcriptional regulator